MHKTSTTQKGAISVVTVAVVGFGIALVIFLISFITTQKASTGNVDRNLRLIVPTVPPRASQAPIIYPTSSPVVQEVPVVNEPSPVASPEIVPDPVEETLPESSLVPIP